MLFVAPSHAIRLLFSSFGAPRRWSRTCAWPLYIYARPLSLCSFSFLLRDFVMFLDPTRIGRRLLRFFLFAWFFSYMYSGHRTKPTQPYTPASRPLPYIGRSSVRWFFFFLSNREFCIWRHFTPHRPLFCKAARFVSLFAYGSGRMPGLKPRRFSSIPRPPTSLQPRRHRPNGLSLATHCASLSLCFSWSTPI